MPHGQCQLSQIALRAAPDDRSEMVSQLLFGETYRVREVKPGWVAVTTEPDEYPGWIDRRQHVPIEEETHAELEQAPLVLAGELLAPAKSKHRTLWLPRGARLPHYENGRFRLSEDWTYGGRVLQPGTLSLKEGLQLMQDYLGTPYLWGGRSPLGMDCSGFTQLFFQFGASPLPRDTSQQIKKGQYVTPDNARPGDLAFFKNEKGKMNHVGILLDQQHILHASGEVRMDKWDKKGIFHTEKQTYTHFLEAIKRISINWTG